MGSEKSGEWKEERVSAKRERAERFTSFSENIKNTFHNLTQ